MNVDSGHEFSTIFMASTGFSRNYSVIMFNGNLILGSFQSDNLANIGHDVFCANYQFCFHGFCCNYFCARMTCLIFYCPVV